MPISCVRCDTVQDTNPYSPTAASANGERRTGPKSTAVPSDTAGVNRRRKPSGRLVPPEKPREKLFRPARVSV